MKRIVRIGDLVVVGSMPDLTAKVKPEDLFNVCKKMATTGPRIFFVFVLRILHGRILSTLLDFISSTISLIIYIVEFRVLA